MRSRSEKGRVDQSVHALPNPPPEFVFVQRVEMRNEDEIPRRQSALASDANSGIGVSELCPPPGI